MVAIHNDDQATSGCVHGCYAHVVAMHVWLLCTCGCYARVVAMHVVAMHTVRTQQ